MKEKQASIKLNMFLNMIKTLTTVLFPLVTFPYASRTLGADGVGAVSYTENIISYFSLFSALGIVAYGTREAAKVREDAKKLQQLATELLVINLCTCLLVYIALGIFVQIPDFKNYIALLLVQSLIIICNALGVEWLFVATENYLYITVRSLIFQVIALVALFLFVKTPQDYLVYALINIFATVGSGLMNFVYACKTGSFRRHEKLQLARHLKPILIIFSTNLASTIYLNLDVVMLGYMMNDTMVGYYTVAVRISRAVSTMMGCISTVILPRVTYYLSKGDQKHFYDLIYKALNLILIIIIPAAFGIISISQPFVILFSGESFEPAYTALNILAISLIFSSLNRVFVWQVLVPYGREKEVTLSTTVGALVNFVLNLYFIPKFGFNGAAFTTLLSEFVVAVICHLQCRQILSYRTVYKLIWQYLLAALVIPVNYYCFLNLPFPSIVNMILQVVFSVFFYFMVLLLLRNPYITEEIQSVFHKIKSRK